MTYATQDADRAALPVLLTCEEAAKVARCSARNIARLCERGDLKAAKMGKGWKINTQDLLRKITLAE